MKKTNYGKSKFSGKGFYITLAVCLLAVGVATAIAITQTVNDFDSETLQNSGAESSASMTSDTAAANDTVSDVPKSSADSSEDNAATEQQSSTSNAAQTQKAVATEFVLPLAGDIITPYSNGELVKNETMGDWRTHDGIDIAGEEGTPVKTCADGTVTDITEDPMWGVTITIDHGNYESVYCGLNETVQVKLDQEVALGDVIGSVGKTNQIEIALPSHLHFGMKQDGKWIDPMSVISAE